MKAMSTADMMNIVIAVIVLILIAAFISVFLGGIGGGH